VSLCFTRSWFISNKCWLYLNLLKIMSGREPYWHTKKIILVKLYTHTFLSHILTLKNFIWQMRTQAILCHPLPLQGFMYRWSYKLTHFCVTYSHYRKVIQELGTHAIFLSLIYITRVRTYCIYSNISMAHAYAKIIRIQVFLFRFSE